jgi:3-oxo-5alpha-steroid 4-dehydrogenase
MIQTVDAIEIWTAEVDFIVVGYGIAGVCGAIEARAGGLSVLVLERSSGCSGSSAMASGHFYLGGGTAVQTACGFADSAQALTDYLAAVTDAPERDKIEAFAAGSVELFDWLEACGVPFDRSYFPTKAVIQEGRECLIWTGNERVWPFCDQAQPAPRGHKVAWDGKDGAGGLAMRRLVAHAGQIGVDARYDVQVDSLVMQDGQVIGVGANHFGERLYFRAKHGVLLAGGGFGRNPAMMARHLARFAGVTILGGEHDDGGVIQLGEAAGGTTAHMNGMLVTSPIYPPEQLVQGILVNCAGRRFVTEDSYHTRTSLAIIEQPEGIAYLIVDSATFAYPDWYQQANQSLIDGFETIAEMEARLAISDGAMQATMAEYNRQAAAGEDPAFGKHPDWLKPLDEGPWAAFDFSFGRAGFNGFTLGGLRISVHAEVLDGRDKPIPGLYAAGACASMLAHDANNYASGISLAGGAFFGRQAAHHARA